MRSRKAGTSASSTPVTKKNPSSVKCVKLQKPSKSCRKGGANVVSKPTASLQRPQATTPTMASKPTLQRLANAAETRDSAAPARCSNGHAATSSSV